MNPKIVSYVAQAIRAVEDATDKGQLETAIKVTSQAKSLLDSHVRTGLLRNSIMWASNRADSPSGSAPKIARPTNKLTYRVGSALEYAPYGEFGTRFMTAFPYFRPAVSIVVDGAGYITAISKAMENTVQQKMRGL